MRAAILTAQGAPVEVVDDLEVGAPRAGEVRVRIAATGVCHSDLSLQNGSFPWPTPCVMGHEGAGEIIALGDGVEDLRVGQHCVISWVPHCGSCYFCEHGQVHLCQEHRRSGGAMADGTFRFARGGSEMGGFIWSGTWAAETVLRRSQVVPVDDDVPFDVAALIGCGVLTGVGAVFNTARITPGERVAVIGCGGVGLNVIQGARIAGASAIIAIDPVASKREMALKVGATHACAPDDARAVTKDATDGIKPDAVFEVVGKAALQREAHELVRPGGRAVLVGVPGQGDDPTFSGLGQLFFNEKRILPSYYGSCDPRTDVPRIVSLWRAGMLDLASLVTDTRDLADAGAALEELARGEAIRTVLTP